MEINIINLSLGSLVKLKNTAMKMTVTNIWQYEDGRYGIETQWFDREDQLNQFIFASEQLVSV